jgi:hypothetical protein
MGKSKMTVDLSKFPLPCFVKLRNGEKAWCFEDPYNKNQSSTEYFVLDSNNNIDWFAKSGRYASSNNEHPKDIISEWKEPRSVEYVVWRSLNRDKVYITDKTDFEARYDDYAVIIDRGVWKEKELT